VAGTKPQKFSHVLLKPTLPPKIMEPHAFTGVVPETTRFSADLVTFAVARQDLWRAKADEL
jgi:hypothetical protein